MPDWVQCGDTALPWSSDRSVQSATRTIIQLCTHILPKRKNIIVCEVHLIVPQLQSVIRRRVEEGWQKTQFLFYHVCLILWEFKDNNRSLAEKIWICKNLHREKNPLFSVILAKGVRLVRNGKRRYWLHSHSSPLDQNHCLPSHLPNWGTKENSLRSANKESHNWNPLVWKWSKPHSQLLPPLSR